MTPAQPLNFAAFLTQRLDQDPTTLEWPGEFSIAGALGPLAVLFDQHNALLVVVGARAADLKAPELQICLGAGQQAPDLCSRVLVYGQDGEVEAWQALGFAREGSVAAYWADGGEARLWAKAWGARAAVAPDDYSAEVIQAPALTDFILPSGWSCRAAELTDAAAVTALMHQVFPAYQIPTDPGSLRYTLASGDVHGRLIRTETGELAAYAAWEFSTTGGSAELTDCATAPDFRQQGLMTYLVSRLEEDMADVFGDLAGHSLARADQPAMQAVLARRGWLRTGRLANHFRLGKTWVSAGLWNGPADRFKKRS
ncbi:MAG: GNAT family N-acetyltransferase [Candidatus Krumholzibacteria bacterium]|nr:GNAT family N-acetyltransferase [Candidatus Krumholzibacteria bacterium]